MPDFGLIYLFVCCVVILGALTRNVWRRSAFSAWFMRRLVRWLRRRRYAAMSGRIRALELGLGMVEPTIAEMYANPALVGDGPGRKLPYARATVTQRTNGGRNYFANGDMTVLTDRGLLAEALATAGSIERLIGDYKHAFNRRNAYKHPPYPTALHDWAGKEQCPECVRMLAHHATGADDYCAGGEATINEARAATAHTLRATADQYATWLRGYMAQGGSVTHSYDYPFIHGRFLFACGDVVIDSHGEFGAKGRSIIVGAGTRIMLTDPGAPFGGYAHTRLYFMPDGDRPFRANCEHVVPIFSDPEFDFARESFSPFVHHRLTRKISE